MGGGSGRVRRRTEEERPVFKKKKKKKKLGLSSKGKKPSSNLPPTSLYLRQNAGVAFPPGLLTMSPPPEPSLEENELRKGRRTTVFFE